MVRFEANQGDSRQKVISAGSQRVLRDTTTFRCEFTHLIYTQKRKEGKTIYVDVTGGTLSVTYVQFRGTQKLIDSRDVSRFNTTWASFAYGFPQCASDVSKPLR